MKSSFKFFLLLAMLMAFAASVLSSTAPTEEETFLENDDGSTDDDTPWLNQDRETTLTSSLRGANRFLAQKTSQAVMTCDKYPRVCRAKGSPGPDCCKKKCVNVMTDGLNCGNCGKKCKYPEICCKGGCVNPMSNNKHCGGCNNKCKKGNKCVYGMCSYA